MPSPARVQSIEALEAFRATLLVYLEKAGRILDDATGDVFRTRSWLEGDRRMEWKRRQREQAKRLAQAEAELLTAKLSGHPEVIQERRLVVNKCKRAMEDVEAGMQRVERWIRSYEHEVMTKTQAMTRLRQVLGHDMVKAVAYLDQAAKTLSEYAEMAPPEQPAPAVPTHSPENAPAEGGPAA